MNLPKAYVDGFLVEWEDGEYRAEVKTLAARSQRLSLSAVELRDKGIATAKQAQIIRERLSRTVRRVPEVVVKIADNPCQGMRQIRQYVGYISRRGLLEIEDQDGDPITGKAQLADLFDEWRHNGLDILPENHTRRDTLNLILSMPALTDEVALKRAVRGFASIEFGDRAYVFAYHTPSTDPDPQPPEHPHVHLVVKMEGHDGRRLNPRKADLRRWRETFAAELRANGIEANATSRLARVQRQRGVSRATLAMSVDGRLKSATRDPADREARLARAKDLEEKRLGYYYALSRTLAVSELKADRDLAVAVTGFIRQALSRFNPSRRFASQNRGPADIDRE